MSYFGDTVAAFRAEIGLSERAIDDDQPAVFRFEQGERLYVERRDDQVLVYLEDPTPEASEELLIAALKVCGFRKRNAMPVRACLAGNNHLVFGLAFEDRAFDIQTLHQALNLLRDIRRQVTQ